MLKEIDTKTALNLLENDKESWRVYYKYNDEYRRVIDSAWGFGAKYKVTLFNTQLYEEKD